MCLIVVDIQIYSFQDDEQEREYCILIQDNSAGEIEVRRKQLERVDDVDVRASRCIMQRSYKRWC